MSPWHPATDCVPPVRIPHWNLALGVVKYQLPETDPAYPDGSTGGATVDVVVGGVMVVVVGASVVVVVAVVVVGAAVVVVIVGALPSPRGLPSTVVPPQAATRAVVTVTALAIEARPTHFCMEKPYWAASRIGCIRAWRTVDRW
jgi:hypothetical protein